jgi:hypothetical protein
MVITERSRMSLSALKGGEHRAGEQSVDESD